VALLPQLKLGWLVVGGPAADEALDRLEIIADSYLSVSTAAQLATPAVLAAADAIQARLMERLRGNLARLDAALAGAGSESPLRRLAVQGGWYALVELPRTASDEAWAERTLEEAGVLVHPGYLFDMAEEGTMVVSLLPEPDRFAAAIDRCVALWSGA
jgi:hypothetical protein